MIRRQSPGRLAQLWLIAALALQAQGCQRASYYSAVLDAASSGSGSLLASNSGNGKGFEGGVSRYIHVDPASACPGLDGDGQPLPNAEIDIIGSGPGAIAMLVRSGCSDLAPPRIVSLSAIQFATDGSGDLTYQGLLYVPAPMTAFYVSPAGSDANPGTMAAPFQSLAKAQAAMRASGAIQTSYLRAGTFKMSSTLTLTSADSGETWSYYPPDGVNTAVLDGGGSTDLIALSGASNVTIDGLKMQNVHSFAIWTPGDIRMDNIVIENCDIGFNQVTGDTGGFPSPITLDDVTHARIQNNYVHDTVSHGMMLMAYNAGDSIDGGVISGNVFLRTVQKVSQGGAILICMEGQSQASHVAVTGNFVRDYGATGVSGEYGIDLDDYASDVAVTGNIVAPPTVADGAAFLVWNGHDDQISSNIVDLGAAGTQWTASWYGDSSAIGGVSGDAFTGNIVLSGFTGQQNTPSLSGQAGYSFYENYGPASNYTIQSNVYYNYGGGQVRTDGPLAGDSDPIFENPQISGWLYGVAAGSPVFNAPVSFPPVTGSSGSGWGPPGFSIPQSGMAPSSPH